MYYVVYMNMEYHVSLLFVVQAMLERDGALAGQEVQADVLRMEIGALQGELRRARQELGASEAGRREVGYDLAEYRTGCVEVRCFLLPRNGKPTPIHPAPPPAFGRLVHFSLNSSSAAGGR